MCHTVSISALRGCRRPELGYLDVGAFRAADNVLQLVLEVGNHGGLDGDEEVALGAGVLQDNGEGILNLTVDATVGTQKGSDGVGLAEQHQGLVNRVRT